MTSLALLILVLNLFAYTDFLSTLAEKFQPNANHVLHTIEQRGAIFGTFFAFLCFAAIYFPNTLMVRPHPIFWRLILGCMVAYAMFLTYMLLLPLDQARATLKYFDDRLGKPLPEVSYADDCRIYTPENPNSKFANIYFAVMDCHSIAHFMGWFGKMLIMRDWYIIWICSVTFELCELTFRYWLPNFYECWWDSVLLDVFGCNLIGILLGNLFLKYFSVSKLEWI